jgi:RHS repeat-associated protein
VSDVLYYYHSDHIGSSTFLTDAIGKPYQFMLYLPFGEAMAQQKVAGWSTPYTFTGKEQDAATGLHYYSLSRPQDGRARYLDTRLSIWFGVDPLAEKMPAWSSYAYAFNNPVRFIDPTGMEPVEGDGDFYSNKGKYIGTDGIKDGKIYVMNSDNMENCTKMSCDELKSVSTEVKLHNPENINTSLNNWAKKHKNRSARSAENVEFAMAHFEGKIKTKDGNILSVFAESKTVNGEYNANAVDMSILKSPIKGWSQGATIHTHPFGNSTRFSPEVGAFGMDVDYAIKNKVNLYLATPNSNTIGKLDIFKYMQYKLNGYSREEAQKLSTSQPIKIW